VDQLGQGLLTTTGRVLKKWVGTNHSVFVVAKSTNEVFSVHSPTRLPTVVSGQA